MAAILERIETGNAGPDLWLDVNGDLCWSDGSRVTQGDIDGDESGLPAHYAAEYLHWNTRETADDRTRRAIRDMHQLALDAHAEAVRGHLEGGAR